MTRRFEPVESASPARRTRRRVVALAATAVILALAGAGLVGWMRAGTPGEPGEPGGASGEASGGPVTRPAERVTLTSGLLLTGTLSYGDPVPLQGAGSGMVTALPAAGDVIGIGGRLYEASGVPVVLFRGERPFWRPLELGMTNGPDVRQLEQNLADLGFTAGLDLDVDDTFTANTAVAVKAWQAALGVERTGAVALGAVVAVDAPSVRVDSLVKTLGEPDGGAVLEVTKTELHGYADLTDAQEREIAAGTPVTLTLKDGAEIAGSVAAVEPSVPATDDSSDDTPARAVVDLVDDAGRAAADAVGPSNVRLKLGDETVDDALVVPVTALVADGDDGYALDVLRDGEVVRIPVEIGLIADARVQITSSGGGGADPLEAGEDVVVAS
ncbi:peptidoglycan-binding protein [Agromyces larvae]|uniref:Peptidoglycan-binding protein n=1 Tax=Agromyces larvae TaxID=2929802 RepID=A0ABY4BWQ1_9MICO|nr:peptidoglycan-binding protein [Agromyces larvae]UOE43620.1 peptidoglycan-binding protein [Agromyces larvae]